MSVTKHIQALEQLIAHGLSPEAEIKAYDGDAECYMPITGYVYDKNSVEVQTDSDECEVIIGGNMNFGEAIEALKAGKLVQRSGWNGKSMHLYLQSDPSGQYEPCIVMLTAQGKLQPGWHPSTPDVLATDWQEVQSNAPAAPAQPANQEEEG